MSGEIGVHNDASFVVNGKIGEDCGIGAVTIKELKGLPDCGCGDCNGIMSFGGEGSVVVIFGVENGNLGEKYKVRHSAAKRISNNGVRADRKEVLEFGRTEGDDRIGNCIGGEAEVKMRENVVLKNGDCSSSDHVNEIEFDLVKGKHGDEGVERISEEVETGHGTDKNRENGILENGDCTADECLEESKAEVIEDNIHNEKAVKSVEDTDIADHNNPINCNGVEDTYIADHNNLINCNGVEDTYIADHNNPSNCNGVEDCSSSNGVVREESRSGSLDAKLEDIVVEDQNGNLDVMESADVQVHNVEKSDDGGDVSREGMNTMGENLSMKERNAAKSDIADEIHDDAIPTTDEPQSDVVDSEALSSDENKENNDTVPIEHPECLVASAEKDPKLDVDNVQEDLVNVSSVAAKEEPVHVEVEKEDYVKNEVADSDPVETISESRAENNSASAGNNADIEAVICFGSFGQNEFSIIASEDVTEKKEDQHTVPDPETEQSSPHAEVVDTTPQTDAVVVEAPVTASPKEQAQASEVVKKLFNLLVKFPRFEDDHLKSKISDAQLQVDEKTKRRDSVKAEMHGKKAIYKESNETFGAAVMEEKAARELFKSKRQDIDSVQNEINKVKNAASLGEIDSEISGMEHSIQHETLPLKEERELVNKIRKLKQLRGQKYSSIGGQDELTEALNNREQSEERLKTLKKDADSLRENCLKAEAITKATKKIYHDDGEKLHELQARFKEADEIRQEAYVQLQSLKKELYEKNKPFWKYRDDAKMATDLAMKGDRESLSRFCFEQVETFMEAWNKSNEFREEYVKSNARRTLRRLGTADGRSLGPYEEVPSLPPILNERPAPEKSFPSLASPKQETVVRDVGVGSTAANVLKKDTDTKKQKPKAKNTVKVPTQLEILLAVMERDEIEEKEPKLTKEEQEMARKDEELRKKEETAKLLEQRCLEEKAKAKEALERKKRNAERAEARAAQKTKKEAEQKEKERDKRAKKKEKKKLAGNTSRHDITEGESHAPSELPIEAASVESEVREKPTPTRRPSKPLHFAKQTKISPIPAPLRNRGKRKMQTWMWVVLVAVLVFLLFLAGNVWNLF